MKFSDIHTKIIAKESYNDTSIFIADYESFEEIPLVSRYNRLDTFMRELGNEGVQNLLINLSLFILNTAISVSRQHQRNETLFAITFSDFECHATDGFVIPHIFVYPDGHRLGFLEKLRQRSSASSSEIILITRLFEKNGITRDFEFLESRFHDPACNDEIVRIYAIPKTAEPFCKP